MRLLLRTQPCHCVCFGTVLIPVKNQICFSTYYDVLIALCQWGFEVAWNVCLALTKPVESFSIDFFLKRERALIASVALVPKTTSAVHGAFWAAQAVKSFVTVLFFWPCPARAFQTWSKDNFSKAANLTCPSLGGSFMEFCRTFFLVLGCESRKASWSSPNVIQDGIFSTLE